MTTSSVASIETRSVGHSFARGVRALHDVSVGLRPGVTALVGVNGAGKSTLLSVLAGGLRPTTGSVLVGGADLYGRRRRQLLTTVALMPQHLTLPESLTCSEVVAVIGWMRGLSGGESRRRAAEALDAVGLAEQRSVRVKALSGGMRRRVALAQALVSRPDVLLLDEPSTGLDPQQRRRMVEALTTLVGTVLLSSHVMEDVVETASHVVVLHDGVVRFDGELTALLRLSPAGTATARRAESAFLRVIAGSDAR